MNESSRGLAQSTPGTALPTKWTLHLQSPNTAAGATFSQPMGPLNPVIFIHTALYFNLRYNPNPFSYKFSQYWAFYQSMSYNSHNLVMNMNVHQKLKQATHFRMYINVCMPVCACMYKGQFDRPRNKNHM